MVNNAECGMTRRNAAHILVELSKNECLSSIHREAMVMGAEALVSLILKSKASKKAMYARKHEVHK